MSFNSALFNQNTIKLRCVEVKFNWSSTVYNALAFTSMYLQLKQELA